MPDERDDEALIDINTTPLIDVMLVLLIMLIVTIPLQTHAVKLDVGGEPPAAAAPPPVVRLEVAADGAISWDGQPVPDRAALEVLMRAAATAASVPVLHVRAERQAAYEPVAAVLAAAQRLGLTRIGIVDTAPFSFAGCGAKPC